MPSSPFKVLHPELNHAHLFKQRILPEAEDEEKAAITGPKGGEEMLQGERCESKCGRMEQGCPMVTAGGGGFWEVSPTSLWAPFSMPGAETTKPSVLSQHSLLSRMSNSSSLRLTKHRARPAAEAFPGPSSFLSGPGGTQLSFNKMDKCQVCCCPSTREVQARAGA